MTTHRWRRDIQELKRRIDEKDEALRQYRKQETKITLQLDEERAQRIQVTKELSDYIATRAQEDRDRLQQVEETHRNEKKQLRDAQARETSLLQELHKASCQVLEKKHELDKSQESEKRALRQNDEADKKTNEMGQKLSETQDKALREGEALREEIDTALEQRDEALRKLQLSSMVFTRLITVIDNGEWIESVSSEKALEKWIYAYFQAPARQIFSKLRSADKDSIVCEMFGDIKVMHYPRNLDDKIHVVKKLPVSTESETSPGGIIIPEAATPSTEPQESIPDPAPPKDKLKVVDDHFKPDGLYVCTKPGVGPGRNVLLFSYEVKPISALPRELFASLQPTDTFGQVKEGQPPVKGMNLMNGALMQVYDYMVKSVSSFGMLTTGESIIFLYTDWSSDAATLYYHVAIPAHDIEKAPDNLEETAFYSAVGQYVIFALIAMEHCRDFDQQQRARVRSGLDKGDLSLDSFNK
ncbi:hypothetical protein E4U61_006132 [Claviceps capensis]|nr:hypothetical protein E4U61_006132 [Claviceps capensis]